MLASLSGSFIPFSRTKAERARTGDPRLSLLETYGSFEEYERRYAAVCDRMLQARLLIPEDAARLRESRGKLKPLFAGER
jgi:hypothetical protein